MKVNSQEKIVNDNAELLVIKHQIVDSAAKLVFTNGCFDILHAGHVDYIEKAAQLGDVLVVGVNDDDSVKRFKGQRRPINPLEQRMKVLAGLEAVDFVIPFSEDTPLRLIEAIIPDVLVKGGDYTIETIIGANFVIENGGTVEIIPFVENTSTSEILNKINTL